MQIYANDMPSAVKIEIAYSGPLSGTASRTHGGFDNDPVTLTTIMSRILGRRVPSPPTADELTGY
jgi:hypothetical protein